MDIIVSHGFIKSNIKITRSKTWDMRYNWLRDRQNRMHLRVYWDKGSNNDADYFTKHHAPSHHKLMRPRYILKNNFVSKVLTAFQSHVRGCVYPRGTRRLSTCNLVTVTSSLKSLARVI